MKAQVYITDRSTAQAAIDKVKEAFATGKPHIFLVQEPTKQRTTKQNAMAWALLQKIAEFTGEEDVRYLEGILLSKWFPPIVTEFMGETVSVPVTSISELDREQTSKLINNLVRLEAELTAPSMDTP